MAINFNRTTSITLPGEVSAEILQKTQEGSAVMTLARQTPYFAAYFIRDCRYAMSCVILLLMRGRGSFRFCFFVVI